MKSTLPPVVPTRPLVLLTGFLGAGKTTLLRATLDALAPRQLLADVILNDRENPYLDSESLRDRAASVLPLAGSCVCCEALDELHELALAASRTRHDLLFVELNGSADPLPLLETFTLLESRFLLRPRWQVCVIDCRHLGTRGYYNDLEVLQLETASHFHLSHAGELDPGALARLRQRIASINPQASETDAPDLAECLASALARGRRFSVRPAGVSVGAGPLLSPAVPPVPDDRHRLAHEFTGCQIRLPEPLHTIRIFEWLAALPASVIRANPDISPLVLPAPTVTRRSRLPTRLEPHGRLFPPESASRA